MSSVDTLVDRVCRRASAVHGDVSTVVERITDVEAPLVDAEQRQLIVAQALARLSGLDTIDAVLRDPAVDEVMVNAGREVWTDRSGRLQRLPDLRPGSIDVILERVLSPLGRRLDRTTPVVDARLPDGARLCAVVAPIAVDGTTVSIRRHRRRQVPLSAFAEPAIEALLGDVMERRLNVLVSGTTSSGKTTLLSSLLDLVEPTRRIVTIEDTSEIVLGDRRHAVRLEARHASLEGGAEIGLAALVRTALRLRPDHLVIGEFRGPEALAAVEAMNTGHDGSMSTCHANSAVDALRRVETLVMQAAPSWPLPAIRRQVTRSLDVVVHLERAADGHRRVAEVIEVIESDGEPAARQLGDGATVTARPTRDRR